MFGVVHTVLFRGALVVTLLFVLVATGLTVTRSRLEPVLTGSMTPAVPRHSLILAVPVATSDLRVGDVVVFQPPGSRSSVMHRVVELSVRDGVPVMRTKGDANAVVDPWTIDLRGSGVFRVRATVPRVGVALEFLHNTTRHTGGDLTWPGLLLLIGAIGYAVRLRSRTDGPDDPSGSPAGIAEELRAAGRDIAGCVERLEGPDLGPERTRILRALTGHAARVAAVADLLTADAAADAAGGDGTADGGTGDPAGGRARPASAYVPRHLSVSPGGEPADTGAPGGEPAGTGAPGR